MIEKNKDLPEGNAVVNLNRTDLYKKGPNWKILKFAINCSSYWNDKTEERKKIFLLPLPYPSDIDGSENNFRLWSCIYLAHLLYDALDSCPLTSGALTPIWKQKNVQPLIKKEFNIWKVLSLLLISFKTNRKES